MDIKMAHVPLVLPVHLHSTPQQPHQQLVQEIQSVHTALMARLMILEF